MMFISYLLTFASGVFFTLLVQWLLNWQNSDSNECF